MILDLIPFGSYSRPEILDLIPFFDFRYYSPSKILFPPLDGDSEVDGDSQVEFWQNSEKNASQIMIFLPHL